MDHFNGCSLEKSCCCDLKSYFFIGLITTTVFLLEFFGGLHSASLALLSDSFHSLGHVMALSVMVSIELLSLKSGVKRRLENRGGFLNGLIILLTSFYVIYEAIFRFLNPLEVLIIPMLKYAVIGLAGNAAAILLQRKTKKNDLNDSFLLHFVFDLYNSILVIASGTVIFLTRWFFIDLVASSFLAGSMIYSSINIMRKSCQNTATG